jgi:hypothetical protein
MAKNPDASPLQDSGVFAGFRLASRLIQKKGDIAHFTYTAREMRDVPLFFANTAYRAAGAPSDRRNTVTWRLRRGESSA